MQSDDEQGNPYTSIGENFQPANFRILGVDDEPLNLLVLKKHLQHQGYGFDEASSGMEALDMLERETYDLVLLDIMMPKMDGFEVCRRIRETRTLNQLPVILVTARTQQKEMETGFEAGANDFIPKPFTRRVLQYRIEIQLKWLLSNRLLCEENKTLSKALDVYRSTSADSAPTTPPHP